MALIRTNYSTFVIDEVQGADAQSQFILEEYFDDVARTTFVRVTVRVNRFTTSTGAPIGGDISTIGFDVGDNRTSINITNTVDIASNGTETPLQTSTLTNVNLGGNDRFEFGLQVGSGGAGDVTLNSAVRFDVTNITLSQLIGQRFGTRLQSQGGGSNSSSSRLVGVAPGGSIGDLIWKDDNGNGTAQANEGIDGVRVFLKDAGGSILATAITGDNPNTTSVVEKGYYNFVGLAAGTYTIDVDQTSAPLVGLVLQSGSDPIAVTLPTATTVRSDVDFQYRQPGQANLVINSLGYGAANGVLISPTAGEYFIAPDPNGTFGNTIQITNTGNATSTVGQIVYVRTTNNPFIRIDSVNGQTDGAVGDPIDGIIPYQLPSIATNSSIFLNTVSRIVNADGTLTKQLLTFSLQDVAGTNDFGAATASVSLFLSQTGFDKAANSSLFTFNPFADSILQADFDLSWDNQQLVTEVLRGAGTIVEGAGGQTPGFVHNLLLDTYQGDVDTFVRGTGKTYTTPKLTNLELVWNNPNSIPTANFEANSGSSAFRNSNSTPLDSYLELSDAGLFSLAYATTSIPKYPNPRFTAGTIVQPAIAGNINNPALPNVRIVEFPGTFSGTFEQFVNSLPSGFTYRVNITTSSVLPIVWSNYTGTKVAAIGLPAGETALRINNLTAQDSLNLSNVEIFAAGSSFPTGAVIDGSRANTGTRNTDAVTGSAGNDTIVGTNGDDTLNGWFGNDTLSGGNGNDTFVFGSRFGNDTILDFRVASGNSEKDLLDLRALGINRNNLNTTLNTSNTGGTSVINASDSPYASLVNVGSTSSLRLDLSSFTGRSPLTDTITLVGVTSLPFTSFA